jgi:hypothetical protein
MKITIYFIFYGLEIFEFCCAVVVCMLCDFLLLILKRLLIGGRAWCTTTLKGATGVIFMREGFVLKCYSGVNSNSDSKRA